MGENASHPTIDAFRPGNLLICARDLDFVGIIDVERDEIVLGRGPGELDHPHQPTVLEVTRKGETVWSYFNRERQRDRRGTFYRTIRYEPELIKHLLVVSD